MPEEFIPLAEMRRQKAAPAPAGGGEFVSLAQMRAAKAGAATPSAAPAPAPVAPPEPDPEPLSEEAAIAALTPWAKQMSEARGPTHPTTQSDITDTAVNPKVYGIAQDDPMLASGMKRGAAANGSGYVPMNSLEMALSSAAQQMRRPIAEGVNKARTSYLAGNATGTARGALQALVGATTAPFAPAGATSQAIANADADPSLPQVGAVGRTLGVLGEIPSYPFKPIGMAKEKLEEAEIAARAMGYDSLAKMMEMSGLGADVGELYLGAKLATGEQAIRSRMSSPREIAQNIRSVPGEFMEGRLDRALAGEQPTLPDAPAPIFGERPPIPTEGVLVGPRSGPPPKRAFPQRPRPAPVEPSRMPMVGPEMRGVEPGVGSSPNLPIPQSRPTLTRGEAGRLPAVGGVRIPERIPSPPIRTGGGAATEVVPVDVPPPEPFTKTTVKVAPRGKTAPVAGTEVSGAAEFGVRAPSVKVRAKLSDVGEPAPSDAATPTTGKPAQPELVPPPAEGTVPTKGERAMVAKGGPEAVAAQTGRVVVEQADGTKLLVAPAEAPRATALAEQGKLAEFVNGEGTATNADGTVGKPRAPREAVVARDASGAEVRTILTDTPEKTAAAVARQQELGLKTEVIPADEATLGRVLEQRRTPAEAPVRREVTEARVSKLQQERIRLQNEFNREREALGPVPDDPAAWEARNSKLEALQARYSQKLREVTRAVNDAPSSTSPPKPPARLKGPRAPGMRKPGSEGGFIDVAAIGKGAVEKGKAFASGVDNVARLTIDRFAKDYGKAGEALRDAVLNVKVQKDINVGETFTGPNTEYGKVGRGGRAEVSKNLRKWVEGTTVVPAKFQPLVTEVRASLSKMADILDESGVRVADAGGPRKIKRVGQTYFPRAFDPDWIKAIREENKPTHKGPTPLTDEWRALNNGTIENPWLPEPTSSRSRLDPSFYSANELPRKFKYPDAALAKDDWAAFEQHITRSGANAAEHKVFQYRDLATGGKSLGELERLVDAAARENVKGENPQTARPALEDMALHALGRHESVFGDTISKKFAEGEGLYQGATKLAINPFNMAQQTSQMVNNSAMVGTRPTVGFVSKMFVDTMKALAKGEDPRTPFREATARAQRKGVIKPEAYSTALDLTEGTPGKIVAGARRVTRTLSRGSELLDRLGRLTTAELAPEALNRMEAALKAGGKEAATAERFLRQVRMAESDIAAIRSGTASPFIKRKFEILLNGMVNIEGGAMFRPKWVNSLDNFAPGAGQVVYRFKNYPVQQMRLAKSAVTEAAKGNFKPIVRLAAWTVLHGEALAKLREALWGEDEQRKDWDEIVKNRDFGALMYRLGQDVSLSGTLGLPGSFLPPLLGEEDKAKRTLTAVERQATPPVKTSVTNIWNAGKDTLSRKTATEDGPVFRRGQQIRPMDRWDAFWTEMDELARREVPAYRTVKEKMDGTQDSRPKPR